MDGSVYDKGINVFKAEASKDGERMSVGLMTVGTVDSDQEIVDQKTAWDSMGPYIEAGGPVQYNHDPGANIGFCQEAHPVRRSKSGSWVTATRDNLEAIKVVTIYGKDFVAPMIYHSPVNVNDLWQAMYQGMLKTHSIRFYGSPIGVPENGVQRIGVDRTLEYSVVTVPAQQGAVFAVQLAKAAGLIGCKECRSRLDERLRHWEQRVGPEQARVIVETARKGPDWTDLAVALHRLAHDRRIP